MAIQLWHQLMDPARVRGRTVKWTLSHSPRPTHGPRNSNLLTITCQHGTACPVETLPTSLTAVGQLVGRSCIAFVSDARTALPASCFCTQFGWKQHSNSIQSFGACRLSPEVPVGCIQVDEVQQANLRLCVGEVYKFRSDKGQPSFA